MPRMLTIPQRETLNYYIFNYPAYHEARQALTSKIGRNNFHLPEIMSSANHMKALTTFINRTGRLKRQDQQQAHPQQQWQQSWLTNTNININIKQPQPNTRSLKTTRQPKHHNRNRWNGKIQETQTVSFLQRIWEGKARKILTKTT